MTMRPGQPLNVKAAEASEELCSEHTRRSHNKPATNKASIDD